jgi:hypothetical protein
MRTPGDSSTEIAQATSRSDADAARRLFAEYAARSTSTSASKTPVAEIKRLSVVPAALDRGLGARFTEAALSAARAAG